MSPCRPSSLAPRAHVRGALSSARNPLVFRVIAAATMKLVMRPSKAGWVAIFFW